MTHTESRNEPLPGALTDPVALLAADSAERTVRGMEVGAERDGGAHFDGVSVILCDIPNVCTLRPYHYYAPDDRRMRPVSRETLTAWLAARKVALS